MSIGRKGVVPPRARGALRKAQGGASRWLPDKRPPFVRERPGASVLLSATYSMETERAPNTIEVYVGRLRRKLERESIKTLRGLGYRFG
jgi:hypothetical protein